MKIAVAQYCPEALAIENNAAKHLSLSRLASSNGANLVVFPELSLTGYVTKFVTESMIDDNDSIFSDLQRCCDECELSMVAGYPFRTSTLPQISAQVLRPEERASRYAKKFLHEDEVPFYSAGKNSSVLINHDPNVALAICYESSIREHERQAISEGAEVYVASVAKDADGVATSRIRMPDIAKSNAIPVLMSNCIGTIENLEFVGQSSAWNREGRLTATLDATQEGVIVMDVISGKTTVALD